MKGNRKEREVFELLKFIKDEREAMQGRKDVSVPCLKKRIIKALVETEMAQKLGINKEDISNSMTLRMGDDKVKATIIVEDIDGHKFMIGEWNDYSETLTLRSPAFCRQGLGGNDEIKHHFMANPEWYIQF